jgi:hypothetical protein
MTVSPPLIPCLAYLFVVFFFPPPPPPPILIRNVHGCVIGSVCDAGDVGGLEREHSGRGGESGRVE